MCKFSREALEEIAVDMVLNSMEHNGPTAEAEAWEAVKRINDDDLINFVMDL